MSFSFSRAMRASLLAFALAACTASQTQTATEPAADAAPIVRTTLGDVRGVKEEGFDVFKGIPFAAPPVGEWRWRPPQPAAHWSGVRDATAHGPMCMQPRDANAPPAEVSEDCLTINVWTPRAERGAKRPVMVWVFGGAFFVGSNRLGEEISDLSKRGVVLVAMNYRVGRMGFFAHPAAKTQHPSEAVGNYWLMDQIAGLKWVHDNIEAFGGDPNNVTIFGVSAGGSSVNSLVASPQARGLMQRAIVHSGGGMFNASRTLARAEGDATTFGAKLNAGEPNLAALERLRAIPAADILAAESGPPDFGAIEDGTYLPDRLTLLFQRGQVNDVDYMVGSTSDEASIFGLMGFDAAVMEQRFGVRVNDLKRVYPGLDDATLLREIQTDFIFTAGADGTARFMSQSGHRTRAFHFAYVREGLRPGVKGVPHGGDIPFVFGLDSSRRRAGTPDPTAKDRAVASMVQAYWTNFARTGDPNGEGLPNWPAYERTQVQTLVIDDDTHAVSRFRNERVGAFYDLWTQQNNAPVPRW